MKTVLIATSKPFAAQAVESIKAIGEKAGCQIRLLEKYTQQAELEAAVADVDALIIRSDKVTPQVIAAAPNLKIVVRAGAGYDNVDLPAATEKGVVVMNTPGQNSNAVAELVLGMMVYMARGQFNGKPGSELLGKKLALHAYGNVGKNVARIAKGFGMDVFAHDPFICQTVMQADQVEPVTEVEDIYKNFDYISLHMPLLPQTRGFVNYQRLTSLKQGATIINTARAEVVDEEALAKALAERTDIKYAADVAPPNADELKQKFGERVYFTPKKMGAQTEEANVNAGIAAINQIVAFFEMGDTTFQVNK